MEFTFNLGTIAIHGDLRIPNSTWDERSKTFKAMALHYMDITDYLKNSGIGYTDNVFDLLPYGITFYEGLLVKNGSSHGQKQALCKACGSSVSLRYAQPVRDWKKILLFSRPQFAH